ncbi:hypothetical protein M6D81_03305 [Paenibacillus sp. J5C_2022]|uniref:hypothetical protein n=1 Tax=Paenibacillus sp. J5C2022 TaxID=2977129 RepID=UPI0021D353B9|nr:hypothetical protein [Paenibacillus sp. J5C2022]MCU6707727.1 hypothetical protein [Paenibacillus sp. J5C2022]
MFRSTMKTVVAFMICTVMLAGMLPLNSQAAVLWEEDTLSSVYDPQGNYYTYAPTIIRDGNIEHMWTCHNAEEGVFRDHIYYTKRVDGIVTESRSVLPPGASEAWDSYHVCDPTVLGGKFLFDGSEYDYAMFYLGNDVDGVHHNQIGVAFSNDLEGDWTRYPNPIVSYPNDGFWGVGQPSATSVDGQGHLLLFYTRGDPEMTAGYRIELNLRDMSAPVIGEPLRLTVDGLKDLNGEQDWFNNFDVTYDPSRDRFYAVRDVHPFPSNVPGYITRGVQIVSIEGSSVWGGGGTWKVEGTLNTAVTGFPRNHNAGLLRTPFGTLPEPDKVEVYFADSAEAPNLIGEAEFTYDIWRMEGALNEANPVVTAEIANMSKRHLSVLALVTDLNTNVTELQGITTWRSSGFWIGYRLFDEEGYLLEAGTAYKDRVKADGSFTIPVNMPNVQVESVKLEVYLLSPEGRRVTRVAGMIDL